MMGPRTPQHPQRRRRQERPSQRHHEQNQYRNPNEQQQELVQPDSSSAATLGCLKETHRCPRHAPVSPSVEQMNENRQGGGRYGDSRKRRMNERPSL
jgi:hypothetical protein